MLDDDDLLMFTHDAAIDPDGAKFRALLAAHVAIERCRSARSVLFQVLGAVALTGAFPLITSVQAPPWLRALVQTALLVTLAALGVIVHRELRWRERRTELLAELQPASKP